MKASLSTDNLCDMCVRRDNFPECCPGNVEFGDGKGDDNIVECDNCQPKRLEHY